MDLLNNLRDTALDPSYPAVAQVTGGGRHRPPVMLPALLVVGLFFGLALANQWRAAPAAAQERTELIGRISTTEAVIDDLRARSLSLDRTIRDLRRSTGTLTAAEEALSETLGVRVGTEPAVGPGLRITVDDGVDAAVQGSRVVDTDLRMIANSLWANGAEAIAVNGHRLSSRTAIRNAGDAITVDYRSVTRPYTVEAIGDTRRLDEAFRRSEGGVWVEGLAQHYGIQWTMTSINELTVAADPGLGIDRAHKAR